MSSLVSPPPPDIADKDAFAAAAERRRVVPLATSAAAQARELMLYDLRQSFRRAAEQIFRGNARDQALASLKILSTIAENLIKEPNNPKYTQFKATNTIIQARLIEQKGALEYAIAVMGFSPEVVDFQPLYKHNPRKTDQLQIGAEILRERQSQEAEKDRRAATSKLGSKDAAAAAAEKIKLAFLDDRRTRSVRDEMLKQGREARAAAIARHKAEGTQPPVAPPSPEEGVPRSSKKKMPGQGNRLVPKADDAADHDGPSSEEDEDDEDDEDEDEGEEKVGINPKP